MTEEVARQILKIGNFTRRTTGHGETGEFLEFSVDYGQVAALEEAISQAIQSATAELREENERLITQRDMAKNNHDNVAHRIAFLEAKIERLTAIGAPFPPVVETLQAQLTRQDPVVKAAVEAVQQGGITPTLYQAVETYLENPQ